ncbi:MAG: endonuclease Q family protein [Candidatus Woesearchaeota archaeon]
MIIADLHIHSRFAQGTSKDLTIQNLVKWARIKGIDLLGTGDFTHPEWQKELSEQLVEDETGLPKTRDGFPFMFQTEISLIYTQGGSGRRIHNVVLAPDFDTVKKITSYLLTKGRVDYDGRPIFKIPCPDFVRDLRAINERIEVIPAHIWTPWFSLFGSKSGFDTVKEAFGDQTEHIHALETGLSSDPEMNWRLSQLDDYQLVSFSDAHSYWPWRIGREATIFETELTYDAIIGAMRTGEGLLKTIEVDPGYGKYHFDGHRNCNIRFTPEESKKHEGICPVCKRPLTIGVLNRVEELADRPVGYKPENATPFFRMLPLSELIAWVEKKAVTTKTVWNIYDKLRSLGSENDVLLRVPAEKLRSVVDEALVSAILLNREGKIKIEPGYDGVYGKPLISGGQQGLDSFL